jgi:uncharacterized protein (TIGR00730 family)
MNKIIAVFGSAKLAQSDPTIQQSYDIGKALAQAGYTVMTGGYGGVMEYVSQGASEVGGHVIGVTIPNITLINETIVNPYVKEEIQCTSYDQRLHYLVDNSNGYVVMPGGVGTSHELVEAWQGLRIRSLSPRPLICYGEFWRFKIDTLVNSPYVPDHHAKLVQFAYSTEETIKIIQEWNYS